MLEPAKMFIRARIIRHNARQSYNNIYCYMACVCSLCNACADWQIVVHSCIMPAGLLRTCKTKAKSHIINYLLQTFGLYRKS